jgi:GTPase SAR1 family protein
MAHNHVVKFHSDDEFKRTAPKVILCGQGGVGKTCLTRQMKLGTFDTEPKTTAGMEFNAITTPSGKQLQVFDLAGQMRASAHNVVNFRGAHGVVVVGAVDDNETIDQMRHWLREIRVCWKTMHGVELPPDTPEGQRQPMPVCTFLVFNKIDRRPPSEEQEYHLRSLVEAHGCHGCFFTTATEHSNVVRMFEAVAEDVYTHSPPPPPGPPPAAAPPPSKCACSGGGKSAEPQGKLQRRR